jgi:hypothetical protein
MRDARPLLLAALACAALGSSTAPVACGDPPAGPVAPAEPSTSEGPGPSVLPEPLLGRVSGTGVNLRVGPRVDNEPVLQLARGTVLVLVERLPGWYGVRVPMGFPVAVSCEHVEKEGTDEVRVKPTRLNVRVLPPEEGRPMPGAFRDPFRADQVLTLIREERGWAWVLAPEELVAYVSQDYVEVLGPLAEHAETLIQARDARAKQVAEFRAARSAAAAANDSLALRASIGEAQQRLERLRQEGGHDKTPVALVREALEKAAGAAPHAPPQDRSLAQLMLEDLEREMDVRESRAEAAVAKARGGTPPQVPSIAPEEPLVEIEGTLAFEQVPGLAGGGAYVLWQDEKRKRVLRLGTGGPLPHPDLRARCDGKVWRFRGSSPGERSLGLPVVDVREVLAPTSLPR